MNRAGALSEHPLFIHVLIDRGSDILLVLAHAEDDGFPRVTAPDLDGLLRFMFIRLAAFKGGFSSISTMPQSGSLGSLQASLRRCSMNHAEDCRMPISLANRTLEMPLRAVTSRYMP